MKKVNTKNFKKTLSKFSTGITVVCVKDNNSIYGKTVNSFNSLSLNPPMVLFSLGNYSSSIKQFSKTKFLSINILSSKQKKLSDNFASSTPKFENIKFPIIKGQQIGQLKVTVPNEEEETYNLYATNDIKRSNIFIRFFNYIYSLILGLFI